MIMMMSLRSLRHGGPGGSAARAPSSLTGQHLRRHRDLPTPYPRSQLAWKPALEWSPTPTWPRGTPCLSLPPEGVALCPPSGCFLHHCSPRSQALIPHSNPQVQLLLREKQGCFILCSCLYSFKGFLGPASIFLKFPWEAQPPAPLGD